MRNLIRRFFSAIADGIGSGISTMATTGKKKYLNLEGLTYLCSKIKDALTLKLDKSQIVQNATTAATDKVPSAAVVKNLQDQITQLNTNIVIHAYSAEFFDGDATVLKIKNGLKVMSVQNYLGEMADVMVKAFWQYNQNGGDWIKVYLNKKYTGHVGLKIVGCMSCSEEPL